MNIEKLIIRRYRSIHNLPIDFPQGKPLVICGANNVGKTNILRAIDLFFSLDIKKFDRKVDFPFDIEEGSRGGSSNIRFEAYFKDASGSRAKIDVVFKQEDKQNEINIKGKKDGTILVPKDCSSIIKAHKFFFIEVSNINIPQIISQLIDDEVLPQLDKMRARQTEPLRLLKEFISKSSDAVKDIEKNIGGHLDDFVDDVPGINIDKWEVEILFPQYNRLREAISNLIDFTLYDKNRRKIDAKGSGIQRILLLAIIKYIISKYKGSHLILAIDEPEAFLQPSLQKKSRQTDFGSGQ